MITSQNKIISMKRIKEEYIFLSKNLTNIGVTIGLPNPDNLFEWQCTFVGPSDSPYSGGLFIIKIKFPDDYPEKAPEVYFQTPIYHLNVNQRKKRTKGGDILGHICINTLKWWMPSVKMFEVLNNIYGLFYFQNSESPYSIDAANEYINNHDLYVKKIKYFTKKYANPQTCLKEYKEDWDFIYKEE